MIDNVFRLKPFTIRHGEAAQKVGTDALLLGAWTFATLPSSPLRLLDVGTGTGIIALMLAERFPSAHIEAWEVDNAACRDAVANFEASPYANRLTLHEVNYLDAVKAFASSQHTGFDLIVSNPPYFTEDVPSPHEQRQLARHTEADGLSPETLLRHASELLSPSGSLALITPSSLLPTMRRIATESLLRLSELTYIYSSPNRLIRTITLWRKLSLCEPYIPTYTSHFTLLDREGKPSEAYRSLLSAFLLDSGEEAEAGGKTQGTTHEEAL